MYRKKTMKLGAIVLVVLMFAQVFAPGAQAAAVLSAEVAITDFKVLDQDSREIISLDTCQSATVTFKAKLLDAESIDASAVWALYGQSGKLVGSGAKSYTLVPGISKDISLEITLPQSRAGLTMKVFFWKTEGLLPLCDAAPFPDHTTQAQKAVKQFIAFLKDPSYKKGNGSTVDGVDLANAKSFVNKDFTEVPSIFPSLRSVTASALTKDRALLWLGYASGGVDRVELASNNTESYAAELFAGQKILLIVEEAGQSAYVVTDDSSVYLIKGNAVTKVHL